MSSFSSVDGERPRRARRLTFVALVALCFAPLAAAQDGASPSSEAVQAPPRADEPPPDSGLREETSVPPSDATAAPGPSEPLRESNDPEAAVEAGQKIVDEMQREFGKNSRQTGEAYMDLADAQRRAGDHNAAEKSYLTAIDIYRAVDGPFTPLAINPLIALGDNYRESENYLNAVNAYTEARTVSRRTYGLLNEDQIALLDRMTQVLLEMNKPAEADEQQLEALRIMERNHPPESDEALGAIYKYARWLAENARYQEERDQYSRALRVIRDKYGRDDPRQVRPLAAIGNSFRSQRIPDAQGLGSLNEALELVRAQPNPDKRMLAEVLRDLGDWQVAFTKVDYDGAEYRRAWELLGEVPGGDALRTEWFTGPIYVLREPVSLRGLSEEPNAPMGHVLVKFDLDKAGRPGNVSIVESEPPGLKDEAVLRHIRRSRFRPQMVNGELVPKESLALQFNYGYSPDALTEQSDDKPRKKK